MKRDFLSITDFNETEINEILESAKALKRNKGHALDALKGKTVACIFHKPSLRTRISFEVGIQQLGGHSLYITDNEIKLGVRESIHDIAKVLSRYVSMIEIRTFSHESVVELAKHADVPVINGLTDLLHPCQVMGDMFTIIEQKGKIDNIKVAYLGDGNNVCNSWLKAAVRIPLNLRIATRPETMPDAAILKEAQDAQRSRILVTEDAREAVRGADVVYTDVWASMGQKEKADSQAELLREFQINSHLLAGAAPDCIVMHCLPAERGREITDEVIDGEHSVVFDQAENRMHIQKAIMVKLISSSL